MADMELTPVYLVLADISGYTRFVTLHGASVLHAEEIITSLMEAVLDATAAPLVLNKLEGDAAFLTPRPRTIPGGWERSSSGRCWAFSRPLRLSSKP